MRLRSLLAVHYLLKSDNVKQLKKNIYIHFLMQMQISQHLYSCINTSESHDSIWYYVAYNYDSTCERGRKQPVTVETQFHLLVKRMNCETENGRWKAARTDMKTSIPRHSSSKKEINIQRNGNIFTPATWSTTTTKRVRGKRCAFK